MRSSVFSPNVSAESIEFMGRLCFVEFIPTVASIEFKNADVHQHFLHVDDLH